MKLPQLPDRLIAGGHEIMGTQALSKLYAAVEAHPEMGKVTPAIRTRAITEAINRHSGAVALAELKPGEAFPLTLPMVERAFHDTLKIGKNSADTAASKSRPHQRTMTVFKAGLEHLTEPAAATKPNRLGFNWGKAAPSDQITAGICFLSGASFLIDAAARTHQEFQRDETGVRHPSFMGMTIAIAELAAGIAAGIFGKMVIDRSGAAAMR